MAILGYNTVGSLNSGTSGRIYGNVGGTFLDDTASKSGVVNRVYFYCNSGYSGDETIEVGVYTSSGGMPNTLVGKTTLTGAASQWVSKDVTALNWQITSGNDYYVCFETLITNWPANPYAYNSSQTGATGLYKDSVSELPATWPASTDSHLSGTIFSAYIEYGIVEVTKVIDPDMGSGYDYDSVYDYEAAQQGDLTGARDERAVAKCRCTGGTADVTKFTIDGWTTSVTQYVKIWTDPSEAYRHAGKYETGNHYRIESSNGILITVSDSHVWIDGLQVYITGANAANNGGIFARTGITNLKVSNCVIRGCNANYGYNDAIQFYDGSYGNHYIWNCIIYDFSLGSSCGGITSWDSGSSIYIYNCTFHNCYYGIYQSLGTVTAKNCLTAACTAEGFNGTITTSYCASSMADGLAGTGDRNSQTFTFVDVNADDFHLARNDAGAAGYGLNLYNDATFPFQNDIDGQDRGGAGADWDIGADEYVAETPAGEVVTVTDVATVSISEAVVQPNPNVYDSLTITEYVSASVSELNATTFDSISVQENVSNRLSITVDVFDSTSVTEYIVTENTLLYFSIFDSVSVQEFISSLVSGESIDVYDSTTVTESVTLTVSTPIVAVFDSITVTELVTLSVSDLLLTVFDSVGITEYVSSLVSLCSIEVYDSSVVTEFVVIDCSTLGTSVFDSALVQESIDTNILLFVTAYDSTSVTDVPTVDRVENVVNIELKEDKGESVVITESIVLLCTSVVSNFDTCSVLETVTAAVSDLPVSVFDSTNITEYNIISNTECTCSVYDSIGVTEQVSTLLPFYCVTIFDSSTISEDITQIVSACILNVYDSSTITESVNVVPEGAVPLLQPEVNDLVSVTEYVNLSVSSLIFSVYDSTAVTEYVICAVSSLSISNYDTVTVTEFNNLAVSTLGAGAVETVSAQENVIVAVGALVLSVVESSSLSESTISTVSAPLISIFDSILVEEFKSLSLEGIVQDVEVIVQDSLSLAESTGAQVSDLPGSVHDTVTLSEQAAAEIRLQVEAVDGISVTTATTVALPELNLNTYSPISVSEYIAFTGEAQCSVSDNIGVVDSPVLCQELEVFSYSLTTLLEFARPESIYNLSIIDNVLVSEYVLGIASGLSLSVYDETLVTSSAYIYWIQSAGILVLDVDIIVPIIDTELLAPEANVYIQLPIIDLEVG